MHKIDSNGATVTNEFTEGSASLNIPATVVSAAWLNAVQNEIINVLSEVGITPLTSGTDTQNQLLTAIKTLVERGGRGTPITQTLANNQASAADVTSFPQLDTALHRAVIFDFYARRRTDSSNQVQSGEGAIIWNPDTNTWTVSLETKGDEVVFELSMVSVSGTLWKLQYTTDNLAGASYVGLLEITGLRYLKV